MKFPKSLCASKEKYQSRNDNCKYLRRDFETLEQGLVEV